MNNEGEKIRNPNYLWTTRGSFWGTILFLIPSLFFEIYAGKDTSILINMLVLLLLAYVALGNYIFGYRFDNPPTWARWVVPAKWIVEAREIAYADLEVMKADPKRLGRLITGVVLLMISLLVLIGVNL